MRLLVRGIELKRDRQLIPGFVEESDVGVKSTKGNARLSQIGVERERSPVLTNRALMWKAARLRPEQVAAGEGRIGEGGIELHRRVNGRVCPCLPLRHRADVKESPRRRDRDPRVSL